MWRAACLVVIACGGTKPRDTAPPANTKLVDEAPEAGPTCEAALDHAMQLAAEWYAQRASPEEVTKLRDRQAQHRGLVISGCIQDKWSVDVRACLIAAKTQAASDACDDALTPAQREAFEERLDQTVDCTQYDCAHGGVQR